MVLGLSPVGPEDPLWWGRSLFPRMCWDLPPSALSLTDSLYQEPSSTTHNQPSVSMTTKNDNATLAYRDTCTRGNGVSLRGRLHVCVCTCVCVSARALTCTLMGAIVYVLLNNGTIAPQRSLGDAVFPQQVALTVGLGGE